MAYVTNLDIVSATSEGLIVAAQASVPEASAATVTVLNGGTASNCVVSTGGGLRTWAADGTGLLDTVTVYDGTLFVRSAGNTGRNLTFSGGIGYLQDGATMTDVNIYGGTLSAYTGTLENAKLYGGNLYAIFDSTGMVFSNTTVYGGTFIVRKLNNSAVDVTLSGGVAHLQSATMTDVGVYNGAELILESGWLNRATVYAGGKITGNTNNIGVVNFNDLTVKAGGTATLTYNFLLTGETNIEEGAYIYLGNTNNPVPGVTAKDGVIDNLTTLINGGFGSGVTLTNLRVTGGTTNINSGAVVDGGTLVNGNLQALDAAGGGMIRGVTMSAGTLIVRSAGNSAVDFTLSNGIAHLQDGAAMTDVNIHGGTLSAYTGTLTNAKLYGGNLFAIFDSTGMVFSNTTVYGGTFIFRKTNNSAFGVTLSGGLSYLQEGATMTDVGVNNGATFYAVAGTVNGLTVNAGGQLAYNTNFKTSSIVINDLDVRAGAGVNLNGTAVVNRANFAGAPGNRFYVSSGVTINSANLTDGELWVWDTRGGALLNGITISGGSMILRNAGNSAVNVVMSGGVGYVQGGAYYNGLDIHGGVFYGFAGTVENARVYGGGIEATQTADNTVFSNTTVYGGSMIVRSAGRSAVDLTVSGGNAYIQTDAYGSGVTVSSGGRFYMWANATADSVTILDGGYGEFRDSAVLRDLVVDAPNTNAAGRAYLHDVTVSKARFNGKEDITLAYLASGTVADDVLVSGGSIFLSANASMTDLEQTGGAVILRGSETYVNGATVSGGILYGQNGAVIENVVVAGGGLRAYDTTFTNPAGSAETVRNVDVLDGDVYVGSGAAFHDLRVSGGTLRIEGAAPTISGVTVSSGVDISVNCSNGGHDTAIFDSLENVEGTLYLNGADTSLAGYAIANAAGSKTTAVLDAYGIYDNVVAAGGKFANAFNGVLYDFSDGMNLNFSAVDVNTKSTATGLTAADEIAGGRAAKWTAETAAASGSVVLASGMTGGAAWLELDGYAGGEGTILYGAEGTSLADGTVNLYAKSGALRNLAGGAAAGGSVAEVNLTVGSGMTLTGVAYAGGFGSVAEEVETAIEGGTFAKDFYAGALANKNAEATGVGAVTLTVTDGSFAGNLYGASAVKTAATVGGIRHTAGDVTLTLAGGAAAKSDFCCFAGGYATGDATGTVYTVGNVTVDISGGSWGTARGGRGIFGGVFASQVGAEAGDVAISISGGTMGNVYGGGWAQKNGTSTVGDVAIAISGGTVANVFGGGSHSTSGGSTSADNVSITVSGGDISGAIYARGQLATDTVTGDAAVTFTGAADFSCDVYGYSYVGATEASDATLTFAGYTGEFSGALGGFNSIEFNDGTAMTLATAAANVANSAWKFDVSERDTSLAGKAMLNWSAADFSGDTIALNLAAGSTAEWTLVDAAATTVYNKFDVLVDEVSQGTLALGEQLADGDYKGWGFALDEGTLKFKHLA